jgi:hypothetical protein
MIDMEEDNFNPFYLTQREVDELLLHNADPYTSGWYYWMPGGDLIGPFDTEDEADLEADKDAVDQAEADAESA